VISVVNVFSYHRGHGETQGKSISLGADHARRSFGVGYGSGSQDPGSFSSSRCVITPARTSRGPRFELRAKSYELRALSLHQVRLLVAQVIIDVAEDCLLVFFIQVAAEFSWGAHPEGVRFYDRFLRDQGAGGDDGARSDDGAVEDDGAHADEAAGFDFAAVEDDVVAHGDVVANVDAILFFHAVENGVVLNVGVMADADLVDVAAEDGVHPDAGVLAENDVADELGGVVDIGGVGELGGDAVVGADHGFIRCWERYFGPTVSQNARAVGLPDEVNIPCYPQR